MFIVSITTSKILLTIWFLIVAFALASLAYFLFSAQVRRQQYGKAFPEARRERAFVLKERAAQAIEFIGVIIAVAILALLSSNWIQLYETSKWNVLQSKRLADRFQREQYHEVAIAPQLLFTAFNEDTVGGRDATVGNAFVVTAKLEHALMKAHKCKPPLQNMVRLANVRLESGQFAFTKSPAIDNTSPCYVKWSWVAVPQHDGGFVILAAGTLRQSRGALVNFTKPIHIVVDPAPEQKSIDAASISAIVVGLLSLVGVISTTLINRRQMGAGSGPS